MINLVDEGLKSLEGRIAHKEQVEHLNCSINSLEKGVCFSPYYMLLTLIIDDNLFSSLEGFPVLKKL